MHSNDLEQVPRAECGLYELTVTTLASWEEPDEPGVTYYSLRYDCQSCGDKWYDTTWD
jgi:hypothetical protein